MKAGYNKTLGIMQIVNKIPKHLNDYQECIVQSYHENLEQTKQIINKTHSTFRLQMITINVHGFLCD